MILLLIIIFLILQSLLSPVNKNAILKKINIRIKENKPARDTEENN